MIRSTPYSLEQRLVEPFRAIRFLTVTPAMVVSSALGFLIFLMVWWRSKSIVFRLWMEVLNFLISITQKPWQVGFGFWPEFAKPIILLPKLTAAIPPPSPVIWWSFAIGSIALFIYSGTWKSVFLPVRATTRFTLFLLWISLTCFAISPTQFQHSVDEWSKIYFLGAYGSVVVYAVIWITSVLWFPIKTWVKVSLSLLLLIYFTFCVPLLLFLCVLLLNSSSLLLLPLVALAVAPLIQLGWFVAFYSLALSSGSMD